MKISKIIKDLNANYKKSDTLIFGYWDKEFVQGVADDIDKDYKVTDEDISWLNSQDFDWSSINEQIQDLLYDLIKEANEEEATEDEEELWGE